MGGLNDFGYLHFFAEGYDSYTGEDMFKTPPCPYPMCWVEAGAWCDGWEEAEAEDFDTVRMIEGC